VIGESTDANAAGRASSSDCATLRRPRLSLEGFISPKAPPGYARTCPCCTTWMDRWHEATRPGNDTPEDSRGGGVLAREADSLPTCTCPRVSFPSRSEQQGNTTRRCDAAKVPHALLSPPPLTRVPYRYLSACDRRTKACVRAADGGRRRSNTRVPTAQPTQHAARSAPARVNQQSHGTAHTHTHTHTHTHARQARQNYPG
jgi:hypothetical protein